MTQSEEILEQGLIKTLTEMSYEYVSIKEEENLLTNFKVQLEKHNRKELAEHGREHFTDKEFDKILLYLETDSDMTYNEDVHIILTIEKDGTIWFFRFSRW